MDRRNNSTAEKSTISKENSLVIGLDISTTCTGVCGINGNGETTLFFPIEFKEKANLYEKTDFFIKRIKEEIKDKTVLSFEVEEPLKMFAGGFSSADTLHTLERFNGMCCYAIYNEFGITPKLHNVNSLRSRLGIKINKKDKTKSTKEKVREIVLSLYPNLPIATKTITRGKRKGQIVPEKSSEDCIDAFIVAKSGMLLRDQ
jgi:hypothetical protein